MGGIGIDNFVNIFGHVGVDDEKRVARIDNFVNMGWFPLDITVPNGSNRLAEKTLRSFLGTVYIGATQDFCAPEMTGITRNSSQQIQAFCVGETETVPAQTWDNYSVRDSRCDPNLFEGTECVCVEKSNLFG